MINKWPSYDYQLRFDVYNSWKYDEQNWHQNDDASKMLFWQLKINDYQNHIYNFDYHFLEIAVIFTSLESLNYPLNQPF